MLQSYQKLAEKARKSTDNVDSFESQTSIIAIADELEPKGFYADNKMLYLMAVIIAAAAQVSTSVSSYAYLESMFAIKITNPTLLMFAVVIVLALVEFIKYVTLNTALKGWATVPNQPKPFLLACAMAMIACSVYASIQGGGQMGIDTGKVMEVKSEYDSEISALRAEISDIKKRNTWKGSTYISGKDKKLLFQKESELVNTKAKKENELKSVDSENEAAKNGFMLAFGLFDMLFLLCTYYKFYFKRCVFIERLHEKETMKRININSSTNSSGGRIDNSGSRIISSSGGRIISSSEGRTNNRSVFKVLKQRQTGYNNAKKGYQAPKAAARKSIKDAKSLIKKVADFRHQRQSGGSIEFTCEGSTQKSGGSTKPIVTDEYGMAADGTRQCKNKNCNKWFKYKNLNWHLYCDEKCKNEDCREKAKAEKEKEQLAKLQAQDKKPKRVQLELFGQ